MSKHLVAPSLLSANFLKLGEEIAMINGSEADWFHLDIMDGMFVPNITFGFDIIKQIKSVSIKPLDVHLMIEKPERYIERFAVSGAGIITVHYEAANHLHRLVMQIKQAGAKAGVALNPHTPVSVLEEILPYVDMVLIMSVNPGFGGQKFIETAVGKVRKLKTVIDA
jgi:ribulose-phosphate 3-epimerase